MAETVQSYYAERVKKCEGTNSSNVCENAGQLIFEQETRTPSCATSCDLGEGAASSRVKEALKNVHPDILKKSYGCGSPFPPLVEGCVVLDLGSGTGRDCFVLSQLVGPKGRVMGVDMTPEMLDIANSHVAYHAEKTGLKNVEFKKALLENLVESSGLPEGTFDVVTSNCVVNLTSDKSKVFADVFRLLKPGGEMYFSDVYSLTEIPEEAKKHVEAWNEGYGGALPLAKFEKMVQETGFLGPFVAKSTPYMMAIEKLKEILAGCSYVANTVRLVKPLQMTGDTPQKLRYTGAENFVFAEGCKVEPEATIEFSATVMEAVSRSRYSAFFKQAMELK